MHSQRAQNECANFWKVSSHQPTIRKWRSERTNDDNDGDGGGVDEMRACESLIAVWLIANLRCFFFLSISFQRFHLTRIPGKRQSEHSIFFSASVTHSKNGKRNKNISYARHFSLRRHRAIFCWWVKIHGAHSTVAYIGTIKCVFAADRFDLLRRYRMCAGAIRMSTICAQMETGPEEEIDRKEKYMKKAKKKKFDETIAKLHHIFHV